MKTDRRISVRLTGMLLCLALLMPPFVSCSTADPAGETAASGETMKADAAPGTEDVTGEAEPEDEFAHAESGLDKVDMGGLAISFLSTNWYFDGYGWDEIYAEEYTGEPINDGVYDRNLYMEQNFNTAIRVETSHDVYTARPAFSRRPWEKHGKSRRNPQKMFDN